MYWPYRFTATAGSSASLKSRSKPRDLREEKKRECEDSRERSSSKTRIRRSVGRSAEKEETRNGAAEIRMSRTKANLGAAIFGVLAQGLSCRAVTAV